MNDLTQQFLPSQEHFRRPIVKLGGAEGAFAGMNMFVLDEMGGFFSSPTRSDFSLWHRLRREERIAKRAQRVSDNCARRLRKCGGVR